MLTICVIYVEEHLNRLEYMSMELFCVIRLKSQGMIHRYTPSVLNSAITM